jgi:hypothetical protein
MRQILRSIAEYYDRLIVVAVLLALFASLTHLTVRKMGLGDWSKSFEQQVQALRPKHPVMAQVNSEPFNLVMAEVSDPFRIPAWSNTVFGPEKRVRCFECLKPIPADGQKCPFCGTPSGPPPAPPSSDEDKDGMTDDWERRYGLNPRDAADAWLDPDQDGFVNIEEFRGDTNPNDAGSHPDFATKVKVENAYRVPFTLRFKSHMKGGDGTRVFQVNTVNNGKTYIVKLGEKVGEKGDDFVVDSFEQAATNKQIPGISGVHLTDVSVLTVTRGDKRIPLVLNQPVDWPEIRAAISFPLDGTNWVRKVGDRFELRNAAYVVMDIDIAARAVVLKRSDTGTTFTVGVNGLVGIPKAARLEPETTQPATQEGERTP